MELTRALYFLQRGFLSGNHFAWLSDEPVRIDTGYPGRAAETEAHLAGMGMRLDNVSRILTAHINCDHIGINDRVQQASGCEIWLHRVGKFFIDRRDGWSTWAAYDDQEAEFFEATLGLEDGDRVEVGPHALEVLHLPGPSSDGLTYYLEKEKALLSGDTPWGSGAPGFTERVEGNRTLIDAMDALKRLAGMAVDVSSARATGPSSPTTAMPLPGGKSGSAATSKTPPRWGPTSSSEASSRPCSCTKARQKTSSSTN